MVATIPEAPTRQGYEFEYWMLDGAQYDFATPVTENITLVAKWKEITVTVYYEVKFDSDGGSSVDSQKIEAGKTATKPEAPTKDGFVFGGWFTDSDCTNEYAFSTPVTEDITLYAKWIEETEKFKVNFFFLDSLDAFKTLEVNAGESVDKDTISDTKAEVFDPGLDVFAGYVKDGTVSDVYAGEKYQHKVEYTFLYETEEGWKVFDETVEITKDIDVYYKVKKLSINIDYANESFPFNIYYEDDVRLIDSAKNLMYTQYPVGVGKNEFDHLFVVNTARDKLTIDDKMIEKLVELGILGEDKEILNQEFMLKYSQVLGEENVEKFIVDSAKDSLRTGSNTNLNKGIEEFITSDKDGIKDILSHVDVSENAKNHIIEIAEEKYSEEFLANLGYSNITKEQFINAVENNTDGAFIKVIYYLIDHCHIKSEYVSEIQEYISHDSNIRSKVVDGIIESVYRQDLDKLVYEINNNQQFSVNHRTLFIAEGLKLKLNEEYNYDKIAAKIPQSEKIFRIYPEEKLKEIYNGAFNNLQEQIEAAMAECDADPSAVAMIDCGLTFNINLVDDIYVPLYEGFTEEISDKLSDKFFYSENVYLQQLIKELSIDALLEGSPADADEVYSGYKLKSFDEYYNIALKFMILIDDTVNWYKENILTEEKVEELLTNYEDLALKYTNLIAEFLDGYADGEEEITNKYASAVENAVKTRFPEYYNKLLDWYKTSPVNKKYESSDYELFRSKVHEAYDDYDAVTDEIFDYRYLDKLFGIAERILVESGVTYTFNTIDDFSGLNDTCDDADIYEVSIKGIKGTFVRSRDIYEIKIKDVIITVKRYAANL